MLYSSCTKSLFTRHILIRIQFCLFVRWMLFKLHMIKHVVYLLFIKKVNERFILDSQLFISEGICMGGWRAFFHHNFSVEIKVSFYRLHGKQFWWYFNFFFRSFNFFTKREHFDFYKDRKKCFKTCTFR